MPKDQKVDEQYRTNIHKKNKDSEFTGYKEGDDLLLAEARKRARDAAGYWQDNWEAAEDDLKFLSGEGQWPSQVRTERELEQRPCLVNNVLPTFVDQVLGDQRQNRPRIKVAAVETPSQEPKIPNVAGNKDYGLAETFTAVIRNLENQCDAETAYDEAFQASVESGIGYLRVRTDYVADDSFLQDVVIEEIPNQFSVMLDPGAKKKDRSDGMWALIDDMMPKEEFNAKYPDARPDAVNSNAIDETMGEWFADNMVRVSEYFTRVPCVKELALLSDGRTVYKEDLEPVIDELAAQGITIIRTRKVKTYKTFWRKITGLDVLEGPIEVPSTIIPIAPVWGKSLRIKNKVIYRSVIRHSKDAQRMANYWDSAATESVALAPKAPFIGAEGHVEGRETEWETANVTNRSLLTYVPQYQGDQGPKRSQPAITPAAELQLGLSSTDKIKSTLGMFDASIGNVSNETSGRAILARQRQGDRGSFAFIDNLSKALKHIGRILVETVPKVYDTERVVRLLFTDGSDDRVMLNQQVFDEQSQQWIRINDLGVAKYDVVVTTGPSYQTQRMEAANSMIEFAQAVPQAAQAMADLIAVNMDWPGADVIAERLKKVVPPQVLTAAEQEKLAQDAPPPQPTPEQQVEMAEIEVKGQEVEAAKMQAEADKAKAEADMLKAQLQSQEAREKLQHIEQQADAGDPAYQQVREIVAEAIAELMADQQPMQ